MTAGKGMGLKCRVLNPKAGTDPDSVVRRRPGICIFNKIPVDSRAEGVQFILLKLDLRVWKPRLSELEGMSKLAGHSQGSFGQLSAFCFVAYGGS